MADDLLNGHSPAELAKAIDKIIASDTSQCSPKAKQFRAIAQLQKYDTPIEECTFKKFADVKGKDGIEVQRGISSHDDSLLNQYKTDLISGNLFPARSGVFGHGIYFATTSRDLDFFEFNRASLTAIDYAQRNQSGIVIRAAIRADAKIIMQEQFADDLHLYKGKAKKAGITDAGTIAAALGCCDAIRCPGILDGVDEDVFLVLNRRALVIQPYPTLFFKSVV
jgi:hypothetical protein